VSGPQGSGPAREVERELEALFGSSELARSGVVHVSYVARDAQGRLCPLRMGPEVPRSETDSFVLGLCRARADALLTSALNVRSEPGLSHRLTGRWAPALAAYRAALGKHEAPRCAILTRSGDLPREHPLWSDGTPKVLLTAPERVETLTALWNDRAQIVGLERPSARGACDWLCASGAALVSVEAGPSTANALYEDPSRVDELLLTLWEDAPENPALRAAPLAEDALLFRGLALSGSSRRIEAGHVFHFQHWARAAPGQSEGRPFSS
jgi:riboflavin biosynthesis pyrimidine reductase